jgi:hypothetical protein
VGIYERYRDNHARAKYERSDWLREHRITLAVAAQAAQARYHPFANAARLELVAPEMPPDFDAEWKTLFTPKPRPKPSGEGTFTLPNGLKGFSF